MANQVLFSFPHKTLLILNNNQGKRVVIVLDLEVLQKGEMVGKKIGNPVTIGSDGKVGPPFNFNSCIVNWFARYHPPLPTRMPTLMLVLPTPQRGQMRIPWVVDLPTRRQHPVHRYSPWISFNCISALQYFQKWLPMLKVEIKLEGSCRTDLSDATQSSHRRKWTCHHSYRQYHSISGTFCSSLFGHDKFCILVEISCFISGRTSGPSRRGWLARVTWGRGTSQPVLENSSPWILWMSRAP